MPLPTTFGEPILADAAGRGLDWLVTAGLWILRWAIILPLNWVIARVAPPVGEDMRIVGNPVLLLVIIVLVLPLLETLLECSLVYLILEKLRKPVPMLLFVIASAGLMGALHLVSVMVVINALITGAFIAYVYGNGLKHGHGNAIMHAIAFHAAINFVGWLTFMMSRSGA